MSDTRSTNRALGRLVAKARRKSAHIAFRAAIGPISGSVLQRYVYSIAEHVDRRPVTGHLDDMRVLRPACIERYAFDPSLPPQFRRVKAFDDRYVYRLRNVRVSPRTGLCWLPGGPILGESVGSFMRLTGWDGAALEDPLLKPRTTVEGTAVVLASHGYFHWLLECLPAALHALSEETGATLLVASDAPQYVRQAVALLGLPSVCYADGPVVVERLVMAARDPFSGFVPHEDVEILRSRILPAVAAPPLERTGVYVSRRLSSRGLVNESQLERAVEQLGFDVVDFQTLSLTDQIRISRDSRIMVGPHGAGLGNLVFGRHLQHVLELFAPDYFNDCYGRLAVSSGLSYAPFFCSGSTTADARAQTSVITSAISDALK